MTLTKINGMPWIDYAIAEAYRSRNAHLRIIEDIDKQISMLREMKEKEKEE